MKDLEFQNKVIELIDDLKAVCSAYGLSGDGNEYKIITQVFLYKFLNDKFAYEIKKLDPLLSKQENWEVAYAKKSDDQIKKLQYQTSPDTAKLEIKHFISSLFEKQNDPNFATIFDETLIDIATLNVDVFSIKTSRGEKDILFERLSEYITDRGQRNSFCTAIINKLVGFSFEKIFNKKFDFYSTIFEYLIKDYNTNSGSTYAEYYTPHVVARIIAEILVSKENKKKIQNVSCYDPSAGSGTLLMSLAHTIGEQNCSIYTQDISQKSSSLLRLNLILNSLTHSLPNVIQGNTIREPAHIENKDLKKFNYIVSNPPFKTDFSNYQPDLDSKENEKRFFAGIPNIPPKKKNSMEIYLLFLQHIIFSLKADGKAAVVVPTGFITAQMGIGKTIKKKLIDEKILAGVVSMPSNIFATTGTNVSILFIDKNSKDEVVLIDASKLGKKVKEGKNQKTILSIEEEKKIINNFSQKKNEENFSIKLDYEKIKNRKYSLSAAQYFDYKIEYKNISNDEFKTEIKKIKGEINTLFSESEDLEKEINKQLDKLTIKKK